MKKRYILFGYQIQNGEFCIVQQEGAAVEYIFDAYSNGDSLQQIATHMSSCGPPYRSSDNRWNKNIIARLLSCDIYCGTATIPPLSQKNCISKYSNFAMKSLYPTPAFCSRSVMICNVVVESACIGIPKRINGTAVTVECGRIQFAQKNSLSNFVKSYSGFVGIMKESAIHRRKQYPLHRIFPVEP